LGVFTGEDYVADGHVGLSHFPTPPMPLSAPAELSGCAGATFWTSLSFRSAAGRVQYLGGGRNGRGGHLMQGATLPK
jgi:hypothetical protein